MPDPVAAQARTLHRLHSEMQMLLYTHPFNDARAARRACRWSTRSGCTAPARCPRLPEIPRPPQVARPLRDAALREDWRAWARPGSAGRRPRGPLLRQAEQGQPVRLTLCGERSAQTFHTAPAGPGATHSRLFQAPALYGRARAAMKIIARDIPPRAAWALEQAGVHPLLARLYAARGVRAKDELDDGLARLLPPSG
jgi:hypothetical protein